MISRCMIKDQHDLFDRIRCEPSERLTVISTKPHLASSGQSQQDPGRGLIELDL